LIDDARSSTVAESCVGAGTSAFGYKTGIGTSSRAIETPEESATVGVLVQSMTGWGGHVRQAIDCEQVPAMMQNHNKRTTPNEN